MKEIKDINFLPEHLLHRHKNAKKNAVLVAWIIACAVIAAGPYILPIKINDYYLAEAHNYTVKLDNLSGVQFKVNELANTKTNRDKKNAALAKINEKQVRVVNNIDKINSCIPDNVSMKSCLFSGKNFTAYFTVKSPTQVVELLDRLEKLKIFKKISLSSSPIIDEDADINVKMDLK